METLIPVNNDFFSKCETLVIRTQTTKKSTREKETHYKDASIRNKFTQTIIFITYNTISIDRRVAKERGRMGLPPARLKQVQFSLNIKHAFFDAMS